MKRFIVTTCMFLVAMMTHGFGSASAEAWDIVGRYESEYQNDNYSATITVTRDYKIILEASAVLTARFWIEIRRK